MDNKRYENDMYSTDKKVEHLHITVQRYCMSLTKSKWDAEDLAQETWVKALRAAGSAEHNNPEALLLRIAKNTWIDETRRRAQLSRILSLQKQALPEPATDMLEVEESLSAIMEHLSPLQLAVFLLRDGLELSITDTAELLHTTTGAIKAALHRARERLHQVRDDLEAQVTTAFISENKKRLLREIAEAYRNGDLKRLKALAQHDTINAVSTIAHKAQTKTTGPIPYVRSMLQMAA